MKNCPYCNEQIQEDAIKCKFCGEWLNKNNVAPTQQTEGRKGLNGNDMKKGCLLFLGVIILLLVIRGCWVSNKNKTSYSNKTATEILEESKSKEETAKQSSRPKEWVSVIKQQSSAEKQSNTFTLQGGKQKITYNVTGGSMTLCMIYIVKEGESLEKDGGIPEVMADKAISGETMARKSAGQYYLDVKPANGTCTVEVFEER